MLEIVPFAIDLHDDVFALWERCDGVGLSGADSFNCIRLYLERNPCMSFVAVDDGKVIGTILAGHDGRRGFIHHLAVDLSCRRQGIGASLVEQVTSALRSSGITKIHILVFKNNADGIAFWKSRGWQLRADIEVISKTID